MGVNATIAGGVVAIESYIFVAQNGDDATGLRNRLDKPFATIQGAVDAAQGNDTIEVFAGTYDELVDLTAYYATLGAGVQQNFTLTFFLHAGAIHQYTGVDTGHLYQQAVVAGNTTNLHWYGKGIYRRQGTMAGACMSTTGTKYAPFIHEFEEISSTTSFALEFPSLLTNGNLVKSTATHAIQTNISVFRALYSDVLLIHSTSGNAINGNNSRLNIVNCNLLSDTSQAVLKSGGDFHAERSNFEAFSFAFSGTSTPLDDIAFWRADSCSFLRTGSAGAAVSIGGNAGDTLTKFIEMLGTCTFKTLSGALALDTEVGMKPLKLLTNNVIISPDVVTPEILSFDVTAANVEAGDTFTFAWKPQTTETISYVALGGDTPLDVANGLKALWDAEAIATPTSVFAAYQTSIVGNSLVATNINPAITSFWSTAGQPANAYTLFTLAVIDAGGALVPTLISTLIQQGDGFANLITGTNLNVAPNF